MPSTEVQRTLVKSPPELWAEVSDPASLARHLGAFGEIRITRLEPESSVAWEGERASGTVELQPSGWGTKVTLTVAEAAEAEPEPEPVAVVAEPEPEPEPEPVIAPTRRGFFARFRRRRPAPEQATGEIPVVELEPEPVPVAIEPEPVVAEEPAIEVDAVLSTVLDDLGAAHHRPFSRG